MKMTGAVPGLLLCALTLTACGGEAADARGADAGGGELSGSISIDGSSTVFPITEAVAEEFMLATDGQVRVMVAMSGTGGGFRRFCAGETDISDASRPIKPSELAECEANGIEPVQLTVAWDGLAVMTNPQNDFVECLTVDELRRIWQPGSTVQTWADVRPEWPAADIKLYGPGTNSGTFDYFTEAVMGEEDASRADYAASEDDNVLVQGVTGDRHALGYFGYAYFTENQDRLKLIGVDSGSGCVQPTPETIETGEYSPLSRPVFIYAKREALARPELRRFLEFYLSAAPELVPQVGYVPLSEARYQEQREILATAAATEQTDADRAEA